LRSISEIELSVPLTAGLASANTVTISVIENTRADSLRGLFNTYGLLEGADIVISLLPEGETYANRIKVFTGKVDHATWNTGVQGGIGQLTAVDTSLGANPLLPATAIDTVTYPNAAPQAIGQFLPLIYALPGDLYLVPLLYVNSATFLYKASSHALDVLPANFYVVSGEGTVFGIAGNCTASAAAATLLLDFPVSQGLFLPGTTYARFAGGVLNVTNSANAYDGNVSTLATLTPSSTNSDGEGSAILGVVRGFGTTDQALNTLDVTITDLKRGDPLALTSIATIVINSYSGAAWTPQLGIAQAGPYNWGVNARTITLSFPGLAFGGSVAIEVTIVVTNEGGTGGADEAWTVGEIDFTGRFQVPNDLYPVWAWGVSGLEDSDGHITGSTGSPLGQVGAVLQSILEQFLGLSVDSASFTTAKALLNWDSSVSRFGFGLGTGWSQTQIQGSALLDALAFQMHGYLFPSGAGTWKVLRIPLVPSSQYSFTVSTLDNMVIETSRMETVYHTFVVRFNWSPITKEYQGTLYASPGGTNHSNATIAGQLTTLCADSYARYGLLPTLQIDAWGVAHQATAEDILEGFTRQHWSQSFVVTFDCPFVGIHLEVGDGVTITHAELPSAVSGTVFTVVRVTLRPETGGDAFPIQLQARSQPQ
jgi:hypothetical protein